ncbi:hypothetical protein [Sandarakinorhabdus sp.]|uniref:hypothetical protein n=1 Tax=Sandarakinorhabdus sp. TaxID=1916663 RepID=UPI00333F9C77
MSAAFGSINRNGLPKGNKGAQYGHVQVHHVSKSVISENTKISSLLFPIRDRAFFLRTTSPKIARAAQVGARWALQIMRKRLWMNPQSAPANPMLAKKPARTSLASALRDGLLLANGHWGWPTEPVTPIVCVPWWPTALAGPTLRQSAT